MHLHGSRSCCLCKKIVSSPCVTHDVARAFIFILLLAHDRSTFVSSLSSTSTSQVTLPINKHCADTQNEEYGSVAKTTSSTGYEPNAIDNFDYSETCTAIFQNESIDIDTEPSYSFDAELDDELYQKSALFTTVHSGARRTSGRGQAHHTPEESLLSSQSLTCKNGKTF